MTLGFSNTPGPVKPMIYKKKNTQEETTMVNSRGYLMLAGEIGLGFGALSAGNLFTISMQSDVSIFSEEENKQIVDSVYANITSEIERVLSDDCTPELSQNGESKKDK